jgi:thioredoxin-dependent peroxiredoxin
VEARGFRDLQSQFDASDTIIFGISLDSASSHRQFREAEKLPFDLLVDTGMRVTRLFDVPVTNLLLVKFTGRVTYVIDKKGIIIKAYQDVRPQGHAGEVLSCVLPKRDGK